MAECYRNMQKGDGRHYDVFSCGEITFYGCNTDLPRVLLSPRGREDAAIKAKWKELLIGLLCLFLFASFPKCMIIRAQPLKLTILLNESNSKELTQVCIMTRRCFHQRMICIGFVVLRIHVPFTNYTLVSPWHCNAIKTLFDDFCFFKEMGSLVIRDVWRGDISGGKKEKKALILE